jgi:hypothetical protein
MRPNDQRNTRKGAAMQERVLSLGNNESIATGIYKNNDGTFTALTFSASKTFKSYKGAYNWLAKRGQIK